MSIEQRARDAGHSLRAATEPALDVAETLRGVTEGRRHIERVNRLVALAVVVACVVLAAVIAPSVLGQRSDRHPVSPGASSSRSTQVSAPRELPASGFVDPGTYVIDAGPDVGTFTVAIPAGWEAKGDYAVGKRSVVPPDGMGLSVQQVGNLFANPCRAATGMHTPTVGPSVEDLVRALTSHSGYNAVAEGPITLDGYTGQRVQLAIPASLGGCEAGTFSMWTDEKGYNRSAAGPGELDDLWILDVHGTRVVVDAFTCPGTTSADARELGAVRDSIRITP